MRLRLDAHGSKGTESIRQSDRPGTSTGTGNGVESMDKLFGRGDGSLLSPKFTGIAVYVNERIINDVSAVNDVDLKFQVVKLHDAGESSRMHPPCILADSQ